MKEILELIAEIENWNAGDLDTFQRFGEVPFDGTFVFAARREKINELKKCLEKSKK